MRSSALMLPLLNIEWMLLVDGIEEMLVKELYWVDSFEEMLLKRCYWGDATQKILLKKFHFRLRKVLLDQCLHFFDCLDSSKIVHRTIKTVRTAASNVSRCLSKLIQTKLLKIANISNSSTSFIIPPQRLWIEGWKGFKNNLFWQISAWSQLSNCRSGHRWIQIDAKCRL